MSRLLTIVTVITLSLATSSADAGLFCKRGGCKPECQPCGVRHVCCPSVEVEIVEKKCWKVECEPICVPRVKLPWRDCCEPRCGRIKYVSKLKSHKYECGSKCVYKWDVKECCTRCGKPRACAAPAYCCPTLAE